jgi:hypothetical protein
MQVTGYLKRFAVFIILLALAPLYIVIASKASAWLIPYFWRFFAFFAILNIAVYIISIWGTMNNNKAAVQSFMVGFGLKFLFSIIIIFFYLRAVNVNSTIFLINFFYIYLFHLLFEIYSLLRNLRNQNLK